MAIISMIPSILLGGYMILCLIHKLAIPAFIITLFSSGALAQGLQNWLDWAPGIFKILLWVVALSLLVCDISEKILDETSPVKILGGAALTYLVINGLTTFPILANLATHVTASSGALIYHLVVTFMGPVIVFMMVAGIARVLNNTPFAHLPAIISIPLFGIGGVLGWIALSFAATLLAVVLNPLFLLVDNVLISLITFFGSFLI